jgi:hypothetical protein
VTQNYELTGRLAKEDVAAFEGVESIPLAVVQVEILAIVAVEAASLE